MLPVPVGLHLLHVLKALSKQNTRTRPLKGKQYMYMAKKKQKGKNLYIYNFICTEAVVFMGLEISGAVRWNIGPHGLLPDTPGPWVPAMQGHTAG